MTADTAAPRTLEQAHQATRGRRRLLHAAALGPLALLAAGCGNTRARPPIGHTLGTVSVSSILLSEDGRQLVEDGASRGYSDLPSPIRATAEGALGIALAPLAVLLVPVVITAIVNGVGVGPR